MKLIPGSGALTLPNPLEDKSISMLQKIDDTDAAATTRRRLDSFLNEVEKRAYRMALVSTGDRDESMDIVQDAMISLVTRYASRPEKEWRPLFYRILGNRIKDTHRKRSVKARFHFWGDKSDADASADTEHDKAYDAPDPDPAPQHSLSDSESLQHIEQALAKLPPRQQQAFMFRLWEGMSVKETAMAMRCSEGSVKTHLSRALSTMSETLSPLKAELEVDLK